MMMMMRKRRVMWYNVKPLKTWLNLWRISALNFAPTIKNKSLRLQKLIH